MRDAIQQEEQNTMLLAESDGCAVWQLRNETGEGTVTCYTIFRVWSFGFEICI